MKRLLLLLACWLLATPIFAQAQSHLEQIQARKQLRVCIWPDYYGITLRNPKTQKLEGVDADMAIEFAKDLGVGLEFVDSAFARLIPDVLSDRCDVAMFAVGITPARSDKLRFAKPTLVSDIYGITTRHNRRIKSWEDIDKPGTVVAVIKGTLHEPIMRERLKSATLSVLDTPMAREQEVSSGRADVFMTDYPYSRRMLETTDWARLVAPPSTFHLTHYAYAVAPGDERWLNRVDQFVRDIKRDGRLIQAASRYRLESIVVRD
ncbi:MAG: hypothetical protein RLZZ484_1253 [Pseudomonadota bacterium]|jgi:ABC-type amino acid transport substrate-binding protein